MASNMYVVTEGSHAIVIDPFRDTSRAYGLTVDWILLTHEHYDHISGVNAWKTTTGATVLCSKSCAESIQDPRKNLSNHFKEFCELQSWIKLSEVPPENTIYSCCADASFEDEWHFEWMGHQWYLFEIPGHSMGSAGIILDGLHFFSGDSLLEYDEIELRMPGGSRKKWKEIGAPRLAQLPDGIQVYPGHFETFIYHRN